jgi:2-keto-3-deoxy-L-rhamnonate aldolase RhmA
MARRKCLRDRVRAGETVIGTFMLAFPNAAAATVAAKAGTDFVLIDGEHTGFGWETMTPVLTAIRHAGSTPFVRIPSASRENIGLALDMGAVGLMIPMVGTSEEAAEIASWARYPPLGVRGTMFGLAPHDFTEVSPLDAMKTSNRENIVMAQVETAQALDNVEKIAAVPGIDVLWIGHFDLTTSMGIPTEFDHPDYLAALERIVSAAQSNGVAVGFLTNGPEDARGLVDRGFRVLAYGSDLSVYRTALRSGVEAVRDAIG